MGTGLDNSDVFGAFRTKTECAHVLKDWVEFKGMRQTLGVETWDHTIFMCLPNTIDPRDPKGK